MPRCYMVKKGAPPPDIEPLPCSPTEASVAPPDQNQVKTELPHDAGAAAEYAELRSALISERSAADTEAAHELLSLAAGVPPLPPATVLTVLRPPEPIPVYTYALQPTTIYIMSDEPPGPVYQTVRMPMPLPPGVPQKLPMLIPKPTTKVVWCKKYFLEPNGTTLVDGISAPNYNMVEIVVRKFVPIDKEIDYSGDSPYLRYYPYSELPPMPPLQYNPPSTVIEREPESGTLTTLTIEEVSTDSEPEILSMQVPVIEPVPQPQVHVQQVQTDQLEKLAHPPPASEPDVDSDEEVLSIVAVKEKQTKYDCNECGKRYATSSNLSRHKQTHRSLDSNSAKKCGECGKAYVSMPALAMHVLTHRMGHVCGVCGKLFSRPWLLRGHLRSHTGEKPYNCAACGKAFADRSNLRAHLQTHSSDKKYECPRCKKNFALKSYLNKHQEAACTRFDEDGAAA